VYAAACVAYEVLTSRVLIAGDARGEATMQSILDEHVSPQPGATALARLERSKVHGARLAPLAELLRAAIARDPKRRPTAARLRAGFAAIAPDLLVLPWPIVT
jgi:hypothetical protein